MKFTCLETKKNQKANQSLLANFLCKLISLVNEAALFLIFQGGNCFGLDLWKVFV